MLLIQTEKVATPSDIMLSRFEFPAHFFGSFGDKKLGGARISKLSLRLLVFNAYLITKLGIFENYLGEIEPLIFSSKNHNNSRMTRMTI